MAAGVTPDAFEARIALLEATMLANKIASDAKGRYSSSTAPFFLYYLERTHVVGLHSAVPFAPEYRNRQAHLIKCN